jgi:hypothetical protein
LTTQTFRETFVTVEVFDPYRHRSVLLEGLKPSATMAEIKARAMSELKLPELDWNVRHDRSGRLLQDGQRLEDLMDDSRTQTELVMQPDAGLGASR